jgi:hypothetical protein
MGRDIKFINFSLTFHGIVLFEDTELDLIYGHRYGTLLATAKPAKAAAFAFATQPDRSHLHLPTPFTNRPNWTQRRWQVDVADRHWYAHAHAHMHPCSS